MSNVEKQRMTNKHQWRTSRSVMDVYHWKCQRGSLCYSSRYDDVIMRAIASQITSLTIVYSTVYSGADQRKHQSSASLAFVWGIHRDRWIPRTKGQLRGKRDHLMTSSWKPNFGTKNTTFHIHNPGTGFFQNLCSQQLFLNFDEWFMSSVYKCLEIQLEF